MYSARPEQLAPGTRVSAKGLSTLAISTVPLCTAATWSGAGMASGPLSLMVMAPPEYSSTLSVKSRAQLPPGGMSGMKLTIVSSMGSTVAAPRGLVGAAVVSVGAAVVVVSGAAVVSVGARWWRQVSRRFVVAAADGQEGQG